MLQLSSTRTGPSTASSSITQRSASDSTAISWPETDARLTADSDLGTSMRYCRERLTPAWSPSTAPMSSVKPPDSATGETLKVWRDDSPRS